MKSNCKRQDTIYVYGYGCDCGCGCGFSVCKIQTHGSTCTVALEYYVALSPIPQGHWLLDE